MPVRTVISGNTGNIGTPRKCGRQQFWHKGVASKDANKELKLKKNRRLKNNLNIKTKIGEGSRFGAGGYRC
jgi:hypothetical protein